MSKYKTYAMIISSLVLLLVGVTYSFFNYTKTGGANTLSVGGVHFTSSETGNINLTNVFPIERTDALNDNTNTGEVVITITGDTTYDNGLEYLVSVENLNIETSSHRKIPLGIIVTPEKDNTELGTQSNDYFTVRGGNTSYYKVLANDTIKDGDYIFVGYIRPGQSEINGKIGIRAYIDVDKIAISDTYNYYGTDSMGTTYNWVNGRIVLTTSEWNSLQGNNAISFKVKVEANDGLWVSEPASRNDMNHVGALFSSGARYEGQRENVTEIYFIRMSEEMINAHSNVVDLTEDGGSGVVKAWMDGTKLYIASPGTTYFPVLSAGLFANFTNLTSISFGNIDTSEVENMNSMFYRDENLISLDLSCFDTSNVTNMSGLFQYCTSLESIDLSSFDTSNVTDMSVMFNRCSTLTSIDLKSFDTSSVERLSSMFYGCINLITLDLSGWGSDYLNSIEGLLNECTNLQSINMSGFNFGMVTSLAGLFYSQYLPNLEVIDFSDVNISNVTETNAAFSTPKLRTVYVSNTWDTSGITSSGGMFYNCYAIVGGAGTTYDENHIDKEYARVDGGQSNPGYFTLKTN